MTTLAILQDRSKLAWHRDLVSTPKTHAWVLSLYRAGEHHPEEVRDYFPARHAPCPELAAKIVRHRDDEANHVRIYDRAIASLGEVCETFDGLDVFNNAIRAKTGLSFAIADIMSPSEKTVRVAHFLAHAHFLEQRVHQSLEYHLEACTRYGLAEVVTLVDRVRSDESHHLRYTGEAVIDLVGRRDGHRILDLHRRAEQRANRAFSARQVRSFLARFPEVGRQRHRLLYAAGAFLMDTFSV
ncbi:MAG: hypothetical protein H6729_02730 [Deltaproteobacteria bacterium]|nr:hypothetical protein [Deltaproteobacteria bacterium]